MRRFILFTFGIFSFYQLNAQAVSQAYLDLNDANALVNDGGVFFNDAANQGPGYEVTQGDGAHAIFSMAFWFGGTDANQQLKLSAQKYDNLADQFKGPLSTDGTATADNTVINSLYSVLKSEIDDHIANYTSPGYVLPASIANWPAHGDVSLDQDYYLAPFVDVDSDGNYNPMAGDYPCIRGDKAIYVIMNDKGDVHASGGDPIGIEMHYMFYEYENEPGLENTTFIHMRMINRGTQTLNDFKVSTFLDGDLGYSGDDYMGADSVRNMLFFYNGDDFDEDQTEGIGYGSAPPAIGLVSLADDFASIGYVDAGSTTIEFWHNMNGKDVSGMPWIDPSTSMQTSYLFPADPGNASESASEVALGNAPGDRRGIANIDLGVIVPFAEYTVDYAIVYNREQGGNNIQNASGLRNVADFVQNYFDTNIGSDCVENNTVSLEEIEEVSFSVHPNPSNGQFSIVLGDEFANAQAEILDITGRVVLDEWELMSKETVITLDQPSGVYLLQLIIDGHKTLKRIVLE